MFFRSSIRVGALCGLSSVDVSYICAVSCATRSSASILAASSKAGFRMKSPACSCAAMKDSTSRLRDSSPAQVSSRKARRSPASNSSADSNSALISRHLSGFILAGFISARFIFGSSAKFVIEPRPGRIPFAYDRAGRDSERLRCLFHAQSAEEPQFDYAALARIDSGERVESLVERDQVAAAIGRNGQRVVERNMLRLALVRRTRAASGEIHQDVSHYPGGKAEELSAVLYANLFNIHQPHVSFVDQRRGLQSMA